MVPIVEKADKQTGVLKELETVGADLESRISAIEDEVRDTLSVHALTAGSAAHFAHAPATHPLSHAVLYWTTLRHTIATRWGGRLRSNQRLQTKG
jgi:hypothetical protein